MRVTVDRALFQEIKEGIIALRQLQSNPRRRQIHFIEHRCECSGRFVITLEELPFEDASRAEFRYVIGNGKDIRFIFSSIDDLEKISDKSSGGETISPACLTPVQGKRV